MKPVSRRDLLKASLACAGRRGEGWPSWDFDFYHRLLGFQLPTIVH